MSDSKVGGDTRIDADIAASHVDEILGVWKKYDRDWVRTVKSLSEDAVNANRRYAMAMRLEAAFAADGGQLPLFPEAVPVLRKPRAKGRRMMHDDGGVFRCPKCKETAAIPGVITADARKRGIPCPKCNAVA